MSMVSVENVSRSFGGIKALDNCSLEVPKGQITGLIGPNGAGKSTLIESICGGLKPDSGRIIFDGTDITGWNRARIARLGLARTFQIARPFAGVPVIENVINGRMRQRSESVWRALLSTGWQREEEDLRRQADELLQRVGLINHRDAQGYALSGGQLKLLELARAMMAQPKLLLLDEPMAGVNPKLASQLAEHVIAMKNANMTVLVIEHNLRFVDRVCDSVIVMAEGRVLTQGAFDDVRKNKQVMSVYLGESVERVTG